MVENYTQQCLQYTFLSLWINVKFFNNSIIQSCYRIVFLMICCSAMGDISLISFFSISTWDWQSHSIYWIVVPSILTYCLALFSGLLVECNSKRLKLFSKKLLLELNLILCSLKNRWDITFCYFCSIQDMPAWGEYYED